MTWYIVSLMVDFCSGSTEAVKLSFLTTLNSGLSLLVYLRYNGRPSFHRMMSRDVTNIVMSSHLHTYAHLSDQLLFVAKQSDWPFSDVLTEGILSSQRLDNFSLLYGC